jgi:hypothetical protein
MVGDDNLIASVVEIKDSSTPLDLIPVDVDCGMPPSIIALRTLYCTTNETPPSLTISIPNKGKQQEQSKRKPRQRDHNGLSRNALEEWKN